MSIYQLQLFILLKLKSDVWIISKFQSIFGILIEIREIELALLKGVNVISNSGLFIKISEDNSKISHSQLLEIYNIFLESSYDNQVG
jgi:hypothetical protein